jgi:hypothetical protein
MCKI